MRSFSLAQRPHEPEGSYYRCNRILRMTFIKQKGGDAYGKVPKRIMIAAVIPYLVDATTFLCHCEEHEATEQSQAVRGGEHKGAWPGHEAIARS